MVLWGADMTAVDIDGRTPMYFACVNNQYDSVAMLLELGYDGIDRGDSNGDTPLHVAVSKGHAQVAQFLLMSAANPNATNHSVCTPVGWLPPRTPPSSYQTLLPPNAARTQGHTPAHLASARDVLEVLYEAGASLGQKDLAGRTPLFCCAATNRLDSVLFLLEVDDISIDVPDMRGDTPLHAACCNGFFNCVEFLLQSAADVELLNDQVRCSAHTLTPQTRTQFNSPCRATWLHTLQS